MIAYVLCMGLLCVGVYCVLSKRNIVKIVVGIGIAECAANLFFVLAAYRIGGQPPLFAPGQSAAVERMVDPLPQALVLTSIVIGLGTMALLVALAMSLYRAYGTFDIDAMRELKG